MIGRIQGKLILKKPPDLLIDVNGLGYEVQASMHSIYQLPELKQIITLFTHLIVREDSQTLFGFVTEQERDFFRQLIRINGVGPKLALSILSSLSPNELANVVVSNDLASLKKIPGVGKKTAERLLIEMRHKFKDLNNTDANQMITDNVANPSNRVEVEAVSALISLGYKPQDASRMVTKLFQPELTVEEIIRLSLREAVS
ncbi:MAG: Holliday junction branch migration protein RuvA [Pseudomonadota bacterium]